MRQILLIFLAVLLPLQSVWAGAAAYCRHESAMTTQHFGHHQHEHWVDEEIEVTKKPVFDLDCSTCHVASIPAALAAQTDCSSRIASRTIGWPGELIFSSETARAPDRPQWHRFA